MIEEFIHKADGSLVPVDPFKVVGTKVRYYNPRHPTEVSQGVITKGAIERYSDPFYESVNRTLDPVWACWRGSKQPAYISRRNGYIVEVVD